MSSPLASSPSSMRSSEGLWKASRHTQWSLYSHPSFWCVSVLFCPFSLRSCIITNTYGCPWSGQIISTFISHTIASVLLVPIAQEVGTHLPGQPVNLLIFITALICSAGMGMPVSGFPNQTAYVEQVLPPFSSCRPCSFF